MGRRGSPASSFAFAQGQAAQGPQAAVVLRPGQGGDVGRPQVFLGLQAPHVSRQHVEQAVGQMQEQAGVGAMVEPAHGRQNVGYVYVTWGTFAGWN